MSTKIQWTEDVWNPIIGCNKVSPGCKNCYAIKTAWIRMHNPKMKDRFAGVVEKTQNGSLNWTGKVNLLEDVLYKPLRKKPAIYFVNSMSDLFHDQVPDMFIAEVFAIMFLCPDSIFQILTKRAERMNELLNDPLFSYKIFDKVKEFKYFLNLTGQSFSRQESYPLKNVILGVSVENQATANERIPLLLKTPAVTRFLSCEPLCGNISFRWAKWHKSNEKTKGHLDGIKGIDWVITGGESGCNYPTMHPNWARTLRDQCLQAGIPFFFKQWGNWIPIDMPHDQNNIQPLADNEAWINLAGGHGFHGEEVYRMKKVSKKEAGNILDGNIYEQYPEIINQFKNK